MSWPEACRNRSIRMHFQNSTFLTGISMARTSARTQKGNQTRSHILEAALAIFRERGFEETTMRGIAEAAGVSLGNAYYYFPSKESLIQAFYGRTHTELLQATGPILGQHTELGTRLREVIRAKIDTIMPYHGFAGVLFRTAGDPASPLHPFSEESRPFALDSIALFDEVLRGSTTKIPEALRVELPRLLWLFHLGIILFWIHDRSPDCRRTYRMVDRSAELIAQLISLAGNPLLRPVLNRALNLLVEIQLGGPE